MTNKLIEDQLWNDLFDVLGKYKNKMDAQDAICAMIVFIVSFAHKTAPSNVEARSLIYECLFGSLMGYAESEEDEG